jgi:hypothetical protein
VRAKFAEDSDNRGKDRANLQGEPEAVLATSHQLEYLSTEASTEGRTFPPEAYEAGRADGVRDARAMARAVGSQNQALRAMLERVLDLLVAVEQSRQHGFVTRSVLEVEEIVALARSLLMAQPSDLAEDKSCWWPETLTDDQARAIALRFAATSEELPSLGLVKAWYGAITASLPVLQADDAPPEDWKVCLEDWDEHIEDD